MTTRAAPPELSAPPTRLHFDGTINVPTVLMLTAMLGGLLVSGIGLYSNLNARIEGNTREVALLKNQVLDVKAAQAQDRADVRGDLHDINAKLDQLLWDRGDRAKGKP